MKEVYHCTPSEFYDQPASVIALHQRFIVIEGEERAKEDGRRRQRERQRQKLAK